MALDAIAAARERGLDVTYDFYPYTTWLSSIHQARFAGDWRARYRVEWAQVSVVGEGSLSEARFAELAADPGPHDVIVDGIPRATIDTLAHAPTAVFGSDSPGNTSAAANLHPRGAATFTRFLVDYVATHDVPLGAALYRFSAAPARAFASVVPELGRRGSIEVGKVADLVLLDLAAVVVHADLAHPLAPSDGVIAALVNGTPERLDGHPVSAPKPPGHHLKGVLAR